MVSGIFSERMAETIWLRFSAGGAAVADVAALPVVVPDLLSFDCALSFMPPEGANKRPAREPAFVSSTRQDQLYESAAQQVALPQRATPIFSRRVSTPTAPITTCLPIT